MIISENLLFSHGAELQNYNSGEYIIEEGSTPKYYFQIKTGTVKLSSFLEDGKEFIHGIPFDGHCFVETYLFNDKKYAVNAITVTDCEIIRFEKNKFIELMLKNPEILLNVYAYTADRMHYRYVIAGPFAFQDPLIKLEVLINHLKNFYKVEEKYSFAIPYTRQQLASLTGLRIETVIRTIKKMEKLGVVKIDNSKIYI
ncbi:Crp/Fnr family transcriptional regulator [Chryseobacterium daeguense]|uniref:Crp/Fnr family transcriptional regulator n=1 Tax=Chryseobacterium daeguense TaxID=412438 RepID=UPI0003FEA69A|nr:Crp/Fnr family transcriptional regulator [Chryseobacterium daeguense]